MRRPDLYVAVADRSGHSLGEQLAGECPFHDVPAAGTAAGPEADVHGVRVGGLVAKPGQDGQRRAAGMTRRSSRSVLTVS